MTDSSNQITHRPVNKFIEEGQYPWRLQVHLTCEISAADVQLKMS